MRRHPPDPNVPARLWVVLALTFLNSVGTGVLTNGVFFLTEPAYGFTPARNYGLGLLLGGTYILGAMVTGPILRALVARRARVSERAVYAGLMVALAALCPVPLIARAAAGPGAGHADAWAPWLVIAIYSPLTGALWPITEAFLSGGRSGSALRGAIGAFNVVWSSALVVTYWAMAPLIKSSPLEIIVGVGVIHLGCLLILPALPRRPAQPGGDGHEPQEPAYASLLTVFRFELPASYLILSALTPYLPTVLAELGVSSAWQTPIAATWLLARVLTFVVLQRWHGWHGRWTPAVLGGLLMLAGFSACVMSPGFPSGLGLPVLFVGLICFGVGMGTIYTGALYYAMEVGKAGVEAGGKHEALIGVGYAVGPLCGLGAYGLVAAGAVPESRVEPAIIVAVAAVVLPTMAYALARALRPPRAGSFDQAAAEKPIP